MNDLESLRRDLVAVVDELRATMAEIGEHDVPGISLAHLLLDEDVELALAGPAVRQEDQVSQDDVGNLLG